MEVRLAVLPDDAAGIAAIDTTVQTTNVLAASVGRRRQAGVPVAASA